MCYPRGMNELPRLVGLIGKAGAGKDKFYSTVLSPYYVKVAFADAVKVLSVYRVLKTFTLESEEELLRVFPSVYLLFFAPKKNNFARSFLQNTGTDLVRSYDKDYWIKIADEMINKYHELGINVAVTDVRFRNEAEYILDKGGILVRIEGQGSYDKNNPLGKHQSEKEIEEIIRLLPTFSKEEFLAIVEKYRRTEEDLAKFGE